MSLLWENLSSDVSNQVRQTRLPSFRRPLETWIQSIIIQVFWYLTLTLLLLNTTIPVIANSVDPDQLASLEVNWSGSALFVIKYVNFYQKPGSSNMIGWKLEVGVAS